MLYTVMIAGVWLECLYTLIWDQHTGHHLTTAPTYIVTSVTTECLSGNITSAGNSYALDYPLRHFIWHDQPLDLSFRSSPQNFQGVWGSRQRSTIFLQQLLSYERSEGPHLTPPLLAISRAVVNHSPMENSCNQGSCDYHLGK